ncbi:MAG: quercetin 2,3-dioxygenase [Planctomycetaceae bacterium]|nr:quercetin 2,3-dioxygenase [Planctomycetaceae bacterium]
MATPDNPVLVRRSGEGRHIAAVGDLYRFLATADETNGHYSLWEATVFPGGGPPPHIHLREEEGFFVLQGQVTFWIDGQRHQTFDGSFANMPMGVEHAFKNETDAPARMLILVAPGGLEKMFERTGEVLADPAAPIGPPSLQEIETLLKIAPEYGIEIRVPTEH